MTEEKPKGDIRVYKRMLRENAKQRRAAMAPVDKERKDAAICERVLSLRAYKEAAMLLTYVSTPIEVNTRGLIVRALADGKRVVVPRCVPDTVTLEMYEIRSMEDLAPGTFSVLEPLPERARLVTDFRRSLCIVPGLMFDMEGYRLGYGKGYYDRFLSAYYASLSFQEDDGNEIVGLCYCSMVKNELQHGRYDVPVRLLVTEKFTKSTHHLHAPHTRAARKTNTRGANA